MIEFNGIYASYGKKEVLHGIDMKLETGKTTIVLGPNGSGKSTLTACVTGNMKYTGHIICDGKDIAEMKTRERAKKIAVLPQMPKTPAITVYELVCIGRSPYRELGRAMSKNDKQAVEHALELMDMTAMQNRLLTELSGGERQKAYLAMVLAQNTDAIIFDEPTAFLDTVHQANFTDLIEKSKQTATKTVMLIMHDLTKAVEIADNIVVLNNGYTEFFGTNEQCIESGVIEKVFGVKRSEYNNNGTVMTMYYH